MAGFHKDFERYLTGGGHPLVPGSKMIRAYAEGFDARRNGAVQADNPFPDPVTDIDNNARAWDQGWRDADAGHPSTHVGGPAVEIVEEEARSIKPAKGLGKLFEKSKPQPKTTGRHP